MKVFLTTQPTVIRTILRKTFGFNQALLKVYVIQSEFWNTLNSPRTQYFNILFSKTRKFYVNINR